MSPDILLMFSQRLPENAGLKKCVFSLVAARKTELNARKREPKRPRPTNERGSGTCQVCSYLDLAIGRVEIRVYGGSPEWLGLEVPPLLLRFS